MTRSHCSPLPTASRAIRSAPSRGEKRGALWIGTFGGGLNRLKDGRFVSFTSKDGLLSDNISHIEDDGAKPLAEHHARYLPHRQASA